MIRDADVSLDRVAAAGRIAKNTLTTTMDGRSKGWPSIQQWITAYSKAVGVSVYARQVDDIRRLYQLGRHNHLAAQRSARATKAAAGTSEPAPASPAASAVAAGDLPAPESLLVEISLPATPTYSGSQHRPAQWAGPRRGRDRDACRGDQTGGAAAAATRRAGAVLRGTEHVVHLGQLRTLGHGVPIHRRVVSRTTRAVGTDSQTSRLGAARPTGRLAARCVRTHDRSTRRCRAAAVCGRPGRRAAHGRERRRGDRRAAAGSGPGSATVMRGRQRSSPRRWAGTTCPPCPTGSPRSGTA